MMRRLLLAAAGPFRINRCEWERSDLYDVRSGVAMVRRRGSESHELQIWKRDGDKVVLLTGRPEAELRWLATTLRRALRLPLHRDEMSPKKEVTAETT